jgi:hypothetical protein
MRLDRPRLRRIGALAAAPLGAGLILAQAEAPATRENPDPATGATYWTPERMREAQPYPMPSPKASDAAPSPEVPAGPPVSSPSGEPTK